MDARPGLPAPDPGPGADAWRRQPASRRSAVGTVALESGSALVQADLAAGQILVESLNLELNRGSIEASGSGKRGESGWSVHLEGEAAAVPVQDLQLLWPPDVGAPGPRQWVLSNLSKGMVDKARIVADTEMAPGADLAFGSPAIEGSVSFSGVTARYWHPLPPFEDIGGKAVSTRSRSG